MIVLLFLLHYAQPDSRPFHQQCCGRWTNNNNNDDILCIAPWSPSMQRRSKRTNGDTRPLAGVSALSSLQCWMGDRKDIRSIKSPCHLPPKVFWTSAGKFIWKKGCKQKEVYFESYPHLPAGNALFTTRNLSSNVNACNYQNSRLQVSWQRRGLSSPVQPRAPRRERPGLYRRHSCTCSDASQPRSMT